MIEIKLNKKKVRIFGGKRCRVQVSAGELMLSMMFVLQGSHAV